MTDQPRVSRRSIHLYAWTGIVVSLALIGPTTMWGAPGNTLHTSAQSWGFALFGFSLALATGSLTYLDRLRRP